MKPYTLHLILARRFIPWLLVNYLLMPLVCALLYIGYGKEVAKYFWNELYVE
jgi:hypothetical protein